MGVVATVLQLLKLPDGNGEGAGRRQAPRGHRPVSPEQADYYEVRVSDVAGRWGASRSPRRAVIEQFENYMKLNKKVPPRRFPAIPNKSTEPVEAGRQHRRHLNGEDRREASSCRRSSMS